MVSPCLIYSFNISNVIGGKRTSFTSLHSIFLSYFFIIIITAFRKVLFMIVTISTDYFFVTHLNFSSIFFLFHDNNVLTVYTLVSLWPKRFHINTHTALTRRVLTFLFMSFARGQCEFIIRMFSRNPANQSTADVHRRQYSVGKLCFVNVHKQFLSFMELLSRITCLLLFHLNGASRKLHKHNILTHSRTMQMVIRIFPAYLFSTPFPNSFLLYGLYNAVFSLVKRM